MVELIVQCGADEVETASDALMEELGALSVSVEDGDADTEAERALFGEPGLPAPRPGWERSTLVALFEDADQAESAAAILFAQDWAQGFHRVGLREVAAQDWVRLTQSQFEPVEITPTFWIVPSWHTPPAQARIVIRLDPGMAFGTGTHPTTWMCLRWIARQAPLLRGERVLDYGCGSGILAIGASLHGAGSVDAVDLDPAAWTAAADNARANDVILDIGAPEKAQGVYRGVLANILATPLKVLAPLLCAHVAPGGHLVLAGILERQADELRAAYAPWIALEVVDAQAGWVLMTGTTSKVAAG